jgi:hypothetical protein
MLRYFLSLFAAFLLLPTAVTAADKSCGGIVGDNVCGKSEYCAKGTGSCAPNLPGTCIVIPLACLPRTPANAGVWGIFLALANKRVSS